MTVLVMPVITVASTSEGGWLVLRGPQGWLFGSRKEAVEERDNLVRLERAR
jgi:hypothetical protein